jgi:pseudouridylate synthase I
MNNYKLIIQYDGSNYAGWQVQNNAVTVQQKIIDSISVLLKEKVNLIGAGRTDTGVHALGQTANFRTEKEIDIFKFQYQLNSVLPADISIIKLENVPPEFHARFDAKSRSYLYFLTEYKSPFFNKYSFRYKARLDIEKLNELSSAFIGSHNFTSFSKKNSETKNKFCQIKHIRWKETNKIVVFYIEADRFLHGMVRTIAGTLLHSASNNLDKDYILNLLALENRNEAGMSVPGNGLFLYKVKY